jgi:hypothetical protein
VVKRWVPRRSRSVAPGRPRRAKVARCARIVVMELRWRVELTPGMRSSVVDQDAGLFGVALGCLGLGELGHGQGVDATVSGRVRGRGGGHVGGLGRGVVTQVGQ